MQEVVVSRVVNGFEESKNSTSVVVRAGDEVGNFGRRREGAGGGGEREVVVVVVGGWRRREEE